MNKPRSKPTVDESKSRKINQWSPTQMLQVAILLLIVVITQYAWHIFYLYPDHSDSADVILRRRSLLDLDENDDAELFKSYKFGRKAKKHFVLDKSYTEFQYGSYGNVPKEVMSYQQQMALKIERCPSCWMLYERDDYLVPLLREVARYLNVENYEDLVFIMNASNGINAVLKSVIRILYNELKCGKSADRPCKILQFSTAFPTIKNTLDFINNDPSSPYNHVVTFDLTRDMLSNTDLLVTKLESFLEENGTDILLATFDHVEAFPNNVFDAKRLVQLFRKFKITSFIDGAHAMGHIKVDIADIDPDIWLSNGHKWMYSVRGSAVMYVKRDLHHLVYPPLITNRYKTKEELKNCSNAMQQQFNWQGTLDDSIWLSLKAGLEFRYKFGDDEIREYTHNLAMDAAQRITSIWNTSLLVYNEENIGAMINPILPSIYLQLDETIAKEVEWLLYEEYRTIVYIKEFEGVWYMRLMVAIYHELSDFEWIAYKTLTILYRVSIADYVYDHELDPILNMVQN
eukprot:38410_1